MGSVFGVHASACPVCRTATRPEPFLRVSRVHLLLITPRDARFRRDFSIAPSLTKGRAQKLRCARSNRLYGPQREVLPTGAGHNSSVPIFSPDLQAKPIYDSISCNSATAGR